MGISTLSSLNIFNHLVNIFIHKQRLPNLCTNSGPEYLSTKYFKYLYNKYTLNPRYFNICRNNKIRSPDS